MIVFVSSKKPVLESPKEDRFGRCAWLIKIDTDTNLWEAFPNPGASQSGGAGVAAAQFVIDQYANTVISGDFGPNAARAFRASNIEMRLFAKDISTVQQAIDSFKQSKLPAFQ